MKIATGSHWSLARSARSQTLVLLLGILAAAPGYASPNLKIGDMPPARLGRAVKLGDYRGKIVIIAFWAS